MFSTRIDMSGQEFGYLTVKNYAYTKNKRAYWNCSCICGKDVVCMGHLLRNGHIKSCGCMTFKMVSDSKIDNMQGRTIGRLTFKEYVGLIDHHAIWLCDCSCGNECLAKASSVKSGITSSCGCLAHEILMNRNVKHNCAYLPIYKKYHNMIRRCYDKKNVAYKDYGGRGITVCDEWLDKDNGFIRFYDWSISHGYDDKKLPSGITALSLDRIDVNGNYEPSNCRWATIIQQANNKRTNIRFEYNDKNYTMAEFCRAFNLNYDKTLRLYHLNGDDIYKVMQKWSCFMYKN